MITGTRLAAMLLCAACSVPALAIEVGRSAPLQAFIDEMVTEHGIPRADLQRWFAQARIRDEVIEAMERPAERLPWYRYRELFVTPRNVRRGVAYWRRNADTLRRAYKTYGVAPEVIVAVLGVETRYGRLGGRHRVIDALTTLTLNYPRRSRFFRGELEQFLLLSREEGLDPVAVKGSYAGAIGAPQFLASSYRRYAVDFDGDQRRDLLGSQPDIIGSVAHYLYRHGWLRDTELVSKARVSGRAWRALLGSLMPPRHTIAEMKSAGVKPLGRPVADGELGLLVRLEDRAGPVYRIGYHNFYVITRYNHSVLYAMAVYELSRLIRQHLSGQA